VTQLATLVTRAAGWFGTRVAVIDGDRSATFSDVQDRSTRLANALLSLAPYASSRIALLVPNRLELVEIDVAIIKSGRVKVPINTRLKQEEKKESQKAKTLERELEWVRMAPKARQAKNKARLQAYEDLAGEMGQERAMSHEIVIPPAPRLGSDVVIAKNLKKGYGDVLLYDQLSFDLPRAGIVGIIGPNGAGKTTLFRMITGSEQPDGGSLTLGSTVQIGYGDQTRTLDGARTVWEEVSGRREMIPVGNREINSRAYVSGFNFRGADQQKLVATLSGGERNRLFLAKTLMSGGNLLLLDEPTNDLDVDTLRALEDALLDFSGCAVVISHDRWFLDRIATHILAFEGDSETVWFEGNYQAYIEDLKRRKGADADQPHRVRYKKLTRV
jgi:ATPase subunit of ABC transporter with duplicated ATPase domains